MDKKLLALTIAVTHAKAALAAAKSDAETSTCMATLTSALEAKMKYSKRTRTDELEEDDGAADSAPATSESPSSSDPAPKSSKAEASGESGEAEADSAAGEAAGVGDHRNSALKAMRGRPNTAAAVYDAIVALTGKANLNEAVGALAAIKTRLDAVGALEQRIAKIEGSARADKVSAMLSAAKASGRITPPQVEHLHAQGMKDPKWLKGYLASLPKGKTVRTLEDGPLAAATEPTGELTIASMSKEEREMYETSARSIGLTLEKFLEESKKTAARMAPRIAPRH